MTHTLFDEWLKDHIEDDPLLPERHRKMIAAFKKKPGYTCKKCRWLMRVEHHNKTYLKCGLTKWTHGAGTDWKASWPACGKYSEEVKEMNEHENEQQPTDQ